MPATSPDTTETSRRRNAILALACVAQFMVILDLAIVNVALPAMRDDLNYSQTDLQWVVNAYTLTFAGFLLLGGRAADLFGQRRIFLLGLALFGGASVVAGLAPNGWVLVAARAFQGLGGAVLSPATLTIITTTFTAPRERARAMGLWAALAGAGGTTGVILGGVLTDVASWRWIFLINVPIAIGAFVAGQRLLTARNQRHATQLDAMGGVLVTGGLLALVYAIVSTEQHSWTSGITLGSFGAAVVLLGWFVFHEARVASEPIMPLSLWKLSSLRSANLVMLLMSSGMFAMWFLVSLELQNVRDYSAIRTGLAFVPMTVAIIVAAQISPRLLPRFGARTLVVVACTISAIGLWWLGQATETGSYVTSFLLPGTLTTFGLGLAITPIVSSSMVDARPQEAGLASGLISTSRQVGGAIGLAALSTIAADQTADALTHSSEHAALLVGYGDGLVIGAIALLAAAAAGLLLPRAAGQHRTQSERQAEVAVEGLSEA